jgi:hypothetical protein
MTASPPPASSQMAAAPPATSQMAAPPPCLPMVSTVERVDLPVRSSDLSDPQDFLLGDEHRMEV